MCTTTTKATISISLRQELQPKNCRDPGAVLFVAIFLKSYSKSPCIKMLKMLCIKCCSLFFVILHRSWQQSLEEMLVFFPCGDRANIFPTIVSILCVGGPVRRCRSESATRVPLGNVSCNIQWDVQTCTLLRVLLLQLRRLLLFHNFCCLYLVHWFLTPHVVSNVLPAHF